SRSASRPRGDRERGRRREGSGDRRDERRNGEREDRRREGSGDRRGGNNDGRLADRRGDARDRREDRRDGRREDRRDGGRRGARRSRSRRSRSRRSRSRRRADGGGAGAPRRSGAPPAAVGSRQRFEDWSCPACGDLNFARRAECRKCGAPRQARGAGAHAEDSRGAGARADDWKGASARAEDWTCPACTYLNFARRAECGRCGTPRPAGGSAALAGPAPEWGERRRQEEPRPEAAGWQPRGWAEGGGGEWPGRGEWRAREPWPEGAGAAAEPPPEAEEAEELDGPPRLVDFLVSSSDKLTETMLPPQSKATARARFDHPALRDMSLPPEVRVRIEQMKPPPVGGRYWDPDGSHEQPVAEPMAGGAPPGGLGDPAAFRDAPFPDGPGAPASLPATASLYGLGDPAAACADAGPIPGLGAQAFWDGTLPEDPEAPWAFDESTAVEAERLASMDGPTREAADAALHGCSREPRPAGWPSSDAELDAALPPGAAWPPPPPPGCTPRQASEHSHLVASKLCRR
ncbi:unnamed protein product, partial [Prorocentrum cordatum]